MTAATTSRSATIATNIIANRKPMAASSSCRVYLVGQRLEARLMPLHCPTPTAERTGADAGRKINEPQSPSHQSTAFNGDELIDVRCTIACRARPCFQPATWRPAALFPSLTENQQSELLQIATARSEVKVETAVMP